MTTYDASSVSDAVIAFRKPITLQQGRGLRDNLLAVIEGDATAPRVQTIALSGIRQTKLSATGTNYITITDLDAYKWIELHLAFKPSGTSATRLMTFEASADNGSTWPAIFFFADMYQTGTLRYDPLFLSFGLVDGVLISTAQTYEPVKSLNSYFVSGSGPFNAIRVRQASSSTASNLLEVVPYFMEART